MGSPSDSKLRQDLGVFEALGSHSRFEILNRLSVRTMTISELCRELKLPRVTLRYHLSILAREGLVEEVPADTKRRSVGRPPLRYRAKRQATVDGYPRRRYELIGDVALEALVKHAGRETAMNALRDKGGELAEAMIASVEAKHGVEVWTPERYERLVLLGQYREEGTPVEVLTRTRTMIKFRAFNCPFLALAEKYPELVCDAMDTGFHQGQGRALGNVASERSACMAHDSPYCEYTLRWPAEPEKKKGKKTRKKVKKADS